MTGLRTEVRVHCGCNEDGHQAVAFRTATPGLLVGQWVHKEGRDGRWAILHHATGLSVPYDFGDPETAMACAQALTTHGRWLDVEPDYDLTAVVETLRSYGAEHAGYSRGPLVQRNEVPA